MAAQKKAKCLDEPAWYAEKVLSKQGANGALLAESLNDFAQKNSPADLSHKGFSFSMAYQLLRVYVDGVKTHRGQACQAMWDEIDLLAVKNPSLSEELLHKQMKDIVMKHYLAIRHSTHGSESRIKLFDMGHGSKLGNAIESFLKLDTQYGPKGFPHTAADADVLRI